MTIMKNFFFKLFFTLAISSVLISCKAFEDQGTDRVSYTLSEYVFLNKNNDIVVNNTTPYVDGPTDAYLRRCAEFLKKNSHILVRLKSHLPEEPKLGVLKNYSIDPAIILFDYLLALGVRNNQLSIMHVNDSIANTFYINKYYLKSRVTLIFTTL